MVRVARKKNAILSATINKATCCCCLLLYNETFVGHRMTGPWTPARGKEFSTLSGESWPGGAGADTRPTLLSTTTTTSFYYSDGAGGTRLTMLAPQEGARHIRSRAGHARSLTGHCAGTRIRLPQISHAARSEELPAAARRRRSSSSFSHPPALVLRRRRNRCSAVHPNAIDSTSTPTSRILHFCKA